MIDCLSNPDWLSPQINCLLFLQNIRTGNLEIFDKFFLSITIFGELWIPTLICAITYWCIDFRAGIYLFSLESFNVLLTHLFKMLACVYRPWVIDSRIHPSALAVPFAKGYSFPSGHSAMSASVFGGLAYLLKKNKALCIALICLILIIGFSRLWLGVHTPQDVVCGLLTGLFLVFIIDKLINWAEKDKNRYLYLTIAVDIFAILILVYLMFFNTYRIDYVSGKILVNPQGLKYVTSILYGYALGIINGCFLCRRFCPFNPADVSVKRRIIRGFIGAVGIIVLLKTVIQYLIVNSVDMKFATLLMFSMGITVTLIYPMIFNKIDKNK